MHIFADEVVVQFIVRQYRKHYFSSVRKPLNNTVRRVVQLTIFDLSSTCLFEKREKTKEEIRVTLRE